MKKRCPLADDWFYATQSTTKVSPAMWEGLSCSEKQQIMANPVIGAQLVELERAFERAGLGKIWRDAWGEATHVEDQLSNIVRFPKKFW